MRRDPRRQRQPWWHRWFAWACLALAACDGRVSSEANLATTASGTGGSAAPTAQGTTGTGDWPGNAEPSGPGAASESTCARPTTSSRAVGLSPRQYQQALQDLVGAPAQAKPAQLGTETDLDVLDRPWVTTGTLDRVMREAEVAAQSLQGRAQEFFGCPDLLANDCIEPALTQLMTRAYARPVTAVEVQELMALRDEALKELPADDGEGALIVAVQAILASPSTLYRTEFAQGPSGAGYVLSGHERAAALAAFLLNSVPDQALLEAADSGALNTSEGLRNEALRLLELPRVQQHITGLLLNGYRAVRVFESPKDAQSFPEFTPSLQQSMFDETRYLLEDVLWTRHAPVAELLSSRSTFVNDELAALYGLPAPLGSESTDFRPVTLPAGRAGLLTHASILSALARTDKTSVVARGLFVRRDLLCLPKIPGPPASVQAQVMEQLAENASEVDLAEYRAATSPCNGCHAQFDRFGLALESFDPIGRAQVSAVGPIDLEGLKPLQGIIASAEDLTAVLTEDQRFTQCLAERMMDYALSSTGAGYAYCESDALHEAVAQSDGTLASIVLAIVSHPAFVNRVQEQSP